MALKNILFTVLKVTAAVAMVAEVSQAQWGPGPGDGRGWGGDHGDHGWGPGHGGPWGPGPGHGPGYPPPPPPPPNYPPQPPPNYPPAPGYSEQRTAYIGRRVVNERLQLLQLLQVGPQYRGYVVDSLILNIRGSSAQVSLLVNGQAQASVINPAGSVRLAPNYGSVIGREIGNLELLVNGFADIDSIVISLRLDNGGNVPGAITVPVAVNQRIFSGGRIDVGGLIDMNRYRGLRIISIDINANSVYQSAYLTTLVNGIQVGGPVTLGQYANTFTVYPQNAILGQYSSDVLAFVANGDLNLNSVTLRLSR